MRFRLSMIIGLVTAVLLGGCEYMWENPYAAAPAPDYRIKLVTSPDGTLAAVPPDCPDWRSVNRGPLQNEPWPQYGCAHARNLAAMVERPEDLVEGRDLGPASGTMAAFGVKRYNQGKTATLIDPNAKAPSQIMTTMSPEGEKGGGGEGGAGGLN